MGPWTFLFSYDEKYVVILDLCSNEIVMEIDGIWKRIFKAALIAWHSGQLDMLVPCSASAKFHSTSFCFVVFFFKWGLHLYRFNLNDNKKVKPQVNKKTACSVHGNTENAISLSLRQMLFPLTGRTEALSLKTSRLTFQPKINCQLLLVFFLRLYGFCFTLNIFAF